ncbi:MAG: aminoglycoside phosphotransferase family protein, partial [Blastocatellia bacterium]
MAGNRVAGKTHLMREQPELPKDGIRDCLHDYYGLTAVTLDFLPLGLDFTAGVYRASTDGETCFLVKIKSGLFYESGCQVSSYLRGQGITSVIAPLPNKNAALWTKLDDWMLVVFPFVDGDSNPTGMADEQWREAGSILKRIHGVKLPQSGFE